MVKVNPAGLAALNNVHAAFDELKKTIGFHAPTGRALAVALTNLDTAEMWAAKAVAEAPFNAAED